MDTQDPSCPDTGHLNVAAETFNRIGTANPKTVPTHMPDSPLLRQETLNITAGRLTNRIEHFCNIICQ